MDLPNDQIVLKTAILDSLEHYPDSDSKHNILDPKSQEEPSLDLDLIAADSNKDYSDKIDKTFGEVFSNSSEDLVSAESDPAVGGDLIEPDQIFSSNNLLKNIDANLEQRISIRLVTSRSKYRCGFWVGVSAEGSICPSALLNIDTIDSIFEEVTESGISQNGPLMLTDTNFSPPRYVYFTTAPGCLDKSEDQNSKAFTDEQMEKWIDSVTSTISSWNPSELGIYLAPEILGNLNSIDLLQKLTEAAAKTSEIRDIYLLCGSHGSNSILNAAHQVRIDLQDCGFEVKVYH